MSRVVFVVAIGIAVLPAQSQRCDRACLEGWLDRYVEAFVAHASSPYGMGSGWSSWEDAMSSRPRW